MGFWKDTDTVTTEHNVYVLLPHSHQKWSVTYNVQGMDWLRHVVIPDGVPERRGRVYVIILKHLALVNISRELLECNVPFVVLNSLYTTLLV